MSAYGTLDAAIAGLKQGLSARVASKISGETAGIGFGMPVFGYKGVDNLVYLYHKNVVVLTVNKDLVGGDTIVITIDGTACATVTFDTDQATTALLIKAAILASFPTATITISGANRVFTVEIKDDGDRVGSGVCTGGGGTPATVTPTYDTTMVFKGFSMFTQKEAAVRKDLSGNILVAATAKYLLTEAVNVMVNGWIWVPTAEAVDSTSAVYCVISTSSDYQGYATDDSGSSNLALTGCKFESTNTAAGLALVRVNL